jgi:hypothetical protein
MGKTVVPLKGRSTRKGIFRNPVDCWNSSASHKNVFIQKRKCTKVLYHKVECKLFDDFLESIHPGYGQTLLNYYNIKGPIIMIDIPNILTMDGTQLRRLAKLKLDRMSKSETLRRGLVFKEADFFTFVETFTIYGDVLDSRLKRKAMANALKRCITSRLKYRKQCVTDCSTNIPTGSHDDFILKLAILRAKLLRDLAA